MQKQVRIANTRLDHLEEGAQETVLRGYLLIERILVLMEEYLFGKILYKW